MTELFGFLSDDQVNGYVRNLFVSSTSVALPIIGSSLSLNGTLYEGTIKGFDFGSGDFNNMRVSIPVPLPSSAGDLHIALTNVTTSTTAETGFSEAFIVIPSGNTTNKGNGAPEFAAGVTGFSSALGYNQEGSDGNGAPPNDQLILSVSVTGDAVLLPSLTWHIW